MSVEVPVNVIVVEGVVSSAVSRLELASGDILLRWTVRAGGPDGRQHALPVVWVGPPRRAPGPAEGEEVLVVGALQRRFFRSAGALGSRTEVRADRVVRRPSGARRAQALHAAAGGLAP